ncbi:glycosyl transferase family 90-domain-containing protein [Geopyxis carbonaria]|nr:glycosyl transferase family 90-domain-containing protein [Geopyxis carbonaria]
MFPTRILYYILAVGLLLLTIGILKRHNVAELRLQYAHAADAAAATANHALSKVTDTVNAAVAEISPDAPSTVGHRTGLNWTLPTAPVDLTSLPPFNPITDGENLHFTHSQCARHFPGAYDDLALSVARGALSAVAAPPSADSHDDRAGHVTARLHLGQLYILSRGRDVWHRQSSILHQIHRALLTSPLLPHQIPNITFTFSVNDHPSSDVWSLSRSDSPGEAQRVWLMPDFGFWSWPEPHIGTHAAARESIAAADTQSWAAKKAQAVWRGTVGWNRALRQKLLDTATDKAWADVQPLQWGVNSLAMQEFCAYQMLVYTEGVTYSGRLRYFQHCRSVIISPALAWRVFYSGLMRDEGVAQNWVKVNDDWSDLQEKVEGLLGDPEKAERIANNTVSVFRDRYLTPASEACYWRRLFEAWAEVQPEGTAEKEAALGPEERGTAWESYAVMGGKFEWKLQA